MKTVPRLVKLGSFSNISRTFAAGFSGFDITEQEWVPMHMKHFDALFAFPYVPSCVARD